MRQSGSDGEDSQSFIIGTEIPSQPWPLLLSNEIINWSTFSPSIKQYFMFGRIVHERWESYSQSHSCTKNSLKMLALAYVLVTNIPFSRRGGILIAFFLLSNLLSTDQYVLGPYLESVSLWPKLLKYFSLALATILDVSFRTDLMTSQSTCRLPRLRNFLKTRCFRFIAVLSSCVIHVGSLSLHLTTLLGIFMAIIESILFVVLSSVQ